MLWWNGSSFPHTDFITVDIKLYSLVDAKGAVGDLMRKHLETDVDYNITIYKIPGFFQDPGQSSYSYRSRGGICLHTLSGPLF